MYLLVEADTDRGRRRFIIGGDSGREAEALIRTFVDEDDRIMDETGEWFAASEIDVASVAANDLPVGPSEALHLVM
jgi:D-Tyr-tRNAtyr deacylase